MTVVILVAGLSWPVASHGLRFMFLGRLDCRLRLVRSFEGIPMHAGGYALRFEIYARKSAQLGSLLLSRLTFDTFWIDWR
jgi:hypothetical protein